MEIFFKIFLCTPIIFFAQLGGKSTNYRHLSSDQIGKTRSKSAMKLKEKPKGLKAKYYGIIIIQ